MITKVKPASKRPAERLRYQHDFGPELAVNGGPPDSAIIRENDPDDTKHPTATVASGSVTIDGVAVVPNTNILQYVVVGGAIGETCRILLGAWTTADEFHQVEVDLAIRA